MYFLPANSCESLPMRFWDFMHDYFHSVRRDVQIHKDLSYILNYSFCFFLPETFPDVYMNSTITHEPKFLWFERFNPCFPRFLCNARARRVGSKGNKVSTLVFLDYFCNGSYCCGYVGCTEMDIVSTLVFLDYFCNIVN